MSTAKKVAHPIDVVCRNHQDGAYHCPQCDTPFSRRSNLRRHYQIHLRDSAFKCSNCNKDFTGREELQDHLLSCYSSTWNQPSSYQGMSNAASPPPAPGSDLGPVSQYQSYPSDGIHSYPSSHVPRHMSSDPYPSYNQQASLYHQDGRRHSITHSRGGQGPLSSITPAMVPHQSSQHSPNSDGLSSPMSAVSYDEQLSSPYLQHHSSPYSPHSSGGHHHSGSYSHQRPGSSSSNGSSSIASPSYILAAPPQMPGHHVHHTSSWASSGHSVSAATPLSMQDYVVSAPTSTLDHIPSPLSPTTSSLDNGVSQAHSTVPMDSMYTRQQPDLMWYSQSYK